VNLPHRIALLSLACAALCACGDDSHADSGLHDAGVDAPPPVDLGPACFSHDGGGADFGAIPSDLGPFEAPDLSVPPPDLGPPTATLINGCPSLAPCLATPGSSSALTYTGFAQPFFATYCTRCHATALTGGGRHGAPSGYNWDDRTSVYAHLPEIRDVIGVSNYMPFDRPTDLPCDRRRELVTWIDTGAP